MSTCKDCRFAEFKRTKNGRINPDYVGRCLFPVHEIWSQMPNSVTANPLSSISKASYIDHTSEHDCPQHSVAIQGA